MGERGKRALRVKFDGKLKLEFHGAKITNDAGLWVLREWNEALGLTAGLEEIVEETRIGAKVIRHARYIIFQLAEVAAPRNLFEAILQKIDRLRLLPATEQVQA